MLRAMLEIARMDTPGLPPNISPYDRRAVEALAESLMQTHMRNVVLRETLETYQKYDTVPR